MVALEPTVADLVLEATGATREEVIDILTTTAVDVGAPGWDADAGWGIVAAAAALAGADETGLEGVNLVPFLAGEDAGAPGSVGEPTDGVGAPAEPDSPPPINGDAFLEVPDTKDFAPFIDGLRRCPKSGLHNPLKNNDRYVYLGRVCAKAAQMLAASGWQPKRTIYFAFEDGMMVKNEVKSSMNMILKRVVNNKQERIITKMNMDMKMEWQY